jgi:hypothetical protein
MVRFLAGLLLTFLTIRAAYALPFDHSHQSYTTLLKQHVIEYDDGLKSVVNYSELAAKPLPLKQYLDTISAVSAEQYQQWTPAEQLAFLINAYNAFTLQLIVENYEKFTSTDARSIRDLGGFFSSPWDKAFYTLLGERRTLNWLEHKKIRIDFDEPRIHAALVCAALSCPKLRTEAFKADVLADQLEQQMISFLSDGEKNNIRGTTLNLSKIFDWYQQDFGDIQRYMARYANVLTHDSTQRDMLNKRQLSVRYTEYNWALNSVNNR